MRIKIRGSNLRCKVANKPLNVREQVEVLKRNKDGLSLVLLSSESSVCERKTDREIIYLCSTEYPVLP